MLTALYGRLHAFAPHPYTFVMKGMSARLTGNRAILKLLNYYPFKYV